MSMKACVGFSIWLVLILIVIPTTQASRRKPRILKAVENLIDEATVIAPTNHEVCFSPEERCDLKLVRFLETARSSIDLAVFDINLDQLVHAILVASKRGIRVRVLVDSRQAKGAYSLVSTLKKGGVDVKRGAQRGLMHHKFMVLDGKRIETGSFNFTNHASRANQENQVYLDDPAIVSRFVGRFEKSWSEARELKD
jgi:phosphatidylserine/phosphatidylglycerophosphate/cardiolipin synthase-like enzyme